MAKRIITNIATFKNKRIVVTGDTGFKGSWLATWLLNLGANVYGYALPPKNLFDNYVKSKLEEKYDHINGDIRDKQNFVNFIKKVSPEIVFHLAAQPIVLDSFTDPHKTFETNVMGTVNLLETIRETPSVKSVVIVTSDKVYENKNQILGYTENDSLGGKDPYSASKACDEIIVKSYVDSFFSKGNTCNIATARAGNVIGGGDWGQHRIIPDFFRATNKNEKLEIRNPNYIRPWQHVLEPLFGYLLLALKLLENKNFCGAWNFGPLNSQNLTVQELIEKVIEIFGKGEYKTTDSIQNFSESKILNLDISKSSKGLNWNPTLDIAQTIQFTVDGYSAESTSDNLFDDRINQINKYSELTF